MLDHRAEHGQQHQLDQHGQGRGMRGRGSGRDHPAEHADLAVRTGSPGGERSQVRAEEDRDHSGSNTDCAQSYMYQARRSLRSSLLQASELEGVGADAGREVDTAMLLSCGGMGSQHQRPPGRRSQEVDVAGHSPRSTRMRRRAVTLSVIMPSTPASRRRSIRKGSLMVHTWTRMPRRSDRPG